MGNSQFPLKANGRHLSLKTKLTSWFVIIVILMGMISFITYFTLRGFISNLNNLVETVVLSNLVVNTGGTLLDIGEGISAYIKDKKPDEKKKVIGYIDKINNNMKTLKALIKDEDGKDSYETAETLIVRFNQDIMGAIRLADNPYDSEGSLAGK
jgi:hypothetical protein